MGNKTIFLDENAETILKKIKEQFPLFNFSSFIQEQLYNYGGQKLDESAILKRISEAELLEKQAKDTILFWQKKKEEFLIQQAMKEKAEQGKKEAEQKEMDRKRYMLDIDAYLQGFKEDDKKWSEYQEGIKNGEWKGVVEYAKKKLGVE